MGDIGRKVKEIELEPLENPATAPSPAQEPTPSPAPATEPAKEPVPV